MIPYELVKHLYKNALNILLLLHDKICEEGRLPTDWHHTIILSVLKPNKDASNPESYRPIIFLKSSICKVMESMVRNRLQWYLEKDKLFTKINLDFERLKLL